MKKRFFVLLVLTAGLALYSPAGQAETVRAGAAKQDITPPAGTPLGGFGKRHGKPSTGIHDPLFARALAVTRGEKTFVFVSADLVLIDAELREAVLKKIRAHTPLQESELVLTATHTHSGGGAYGGRLWQKFILGKKQDKVFESLTQNIASAVLQSLESRVPVDMEMAETRIDELIENRMDPKLNYPQILRALRFKTADGKMIGSMIFMAAHPTLLAASNMEFSADFPGALCRAIENKNPGATALLINGAAGDLKPKAMITEDRFEKMLAYGNSLAQKFESLDFKSTPANGPWESVIEKRKLPKVIARLGRFSAPSIFGGRIFPRHSVFQGVRMGQVFVLGYPGELGSEPGHEIENHLRARNFVPLIAGYANDYLGYVVSHRHYNDLEQYESRASFYGPKMDWWSQEEAIRLAEKTLTEDEKKNLRPDGVLTFKEGLPVLKLRGDAYHAGFEEGRLLKKEIRKTIEDIKDYLNSELPVPLANQLLINFSMDHAWKKMEPFVSYEDYRQIKGLADGSGVPLKTMKRMHALPEVYPSWCTNGAYWGEATQGGRMIAIRNLDWNRKIGIHNHAAVKFISIPGRKIYTNIGYTGFSGVLSGMNENGISVGQVGAVSADESMEGLPMPFLLKQVLEDSGGLQDAISIFQRATGTRGYNYVVASALEKNASVIESTHSHLAVFTDNDKNENANYALRVPCAVFRGDPALDPVIRDLQTASGGEPKKPGLEPPVGSAFEIRYLKHGNLVKENYGMITPEIAINIAKELAPGSNIQSVIYAFPEFRVANAKDKLKAAETEYVEFNFSSDGFSKPDTTGSAEAETPPPLHNAQRA